MSLPRWARWLLIGLAVLLALAGAAVFTATRYFDRERVTGMVAAEVDKATGRQIHFDGPIGFRVLPSLALRLEGVRLANADWGTRPDMVKARRLELVVALQPLLRKQFQINRVLLDGVEVWLETDPNGRGNWAMKSKPKSTQAPQPEDTREPMAINLTQAEIRESTITLRNGKTGRSETLGLTRVSLSDAGPTDRLDAQIRLRDQPLSIKGNIGKLADLFAGADSFPLDLTLALEGRHERARRAWTCTPTCARPRPWRVSRAGNCRCRCRSSCGAGSSRTAHAASCLLSRSPPPGRRSTGRPISTPVQSGPVSK
jgi:uncharacterized protein involved in outer membrane biogenesis